MPSAVLQLETGANFLPKMPTKQKLRSWMDWNHQEWAQWWSDAPVAEEFDWNDYYEGPGSRFRRIQVYLNV